MDELSKEMENLKGKITQVQKSISTGNFENDDLILQKAWFEELFNNISHGIVILDPNDRITHVNKAFTKIYQFLPDEVIGKKLNQVIIPEGLFDEGSLLSKTTFEGFIADKETLRKRKDGKMINVRILGVPIHVDGVIRSIFAIYEDITEHKNIQAAKLREAELKAQAAELQAKVAESQAIAAAAQSKALKAENERKTNELEEARNLQLSMLPKIIPNIPGLEIGVYMKTASEVGGDYYDFQLTDDGTFVLAIGDATGHGLKAGTMVTIIKTLFYADAGRMDILPFFDKCTTNIKKMQISNLYMGLTIAKIKNNKMIISSAGMPPFYHYIAKEQRIEKILSKTMPLGAFSGFIYKENFIEFEKEDSIFFLSDGLPELFNENNDTLDFEKIEEMFQKIGNEDPNSIIEKFVKLGERWNNGNIQNDDITLIVLKAKVQL